MDYDTTLYLLAFVHILRHVLALSFGCGEIKVPPQLYDSNVWPQLLFCLYHVSVKICYCCIYLL